MSISVRIGSVAKPIPIKLFDTNNDILKDNRFSFLIAGWKNKKVLGELINVVEESIGSKTFNPEELRILNSVFKKLLNQLQAFDNTSSNSIPPEQHEQLSKEETNIMTSSILLLSDDEDETPVDLNQSISKLIDESPVHPLVLRLSFDFRLGLKSINAPTLGNAKMSTPQTPKNPLMIHSPVNLNNYSTPESQTTKIKTPTTTDPEQSSSARNLRSALNIDNPKNSSTKSPLSTISSQTKLNSKNSPDAISKFSPLLKTPETPKMAPIPSEIPGIESLDANERSESKKNYCEIHFRQLINYCLQCKKPICQTCCNGTEPKTCGKLHPDRIIPLQEYQKRLTHEIREKAESLKKIEQEIQNVNSDFIERANNFEEKMTKNITLRQEIEELIQLAEAIVENFSQNVSGIDFSQIEEMEKTIELFRQFIATRKIEKDVLPPPIAVVSSPMDPIVKSPATAQKASEINAKLNAVNKQKEEFAGKNQELSEKISFYVKENKGLLLFFRFFVA